MELPTEDSGALVNITSVQNPVSTIYFAQRFQVSYILNRPSSSRAVFPGALHQGRLSRRRAGIARSELPSQPPSQPSDTLCKVAGSPIVAVAVKARGGAGTLSRHRIYTAAILVTIARQLARAGGCPRGRCVGPEPSERGAGLLLRGRRCGEGPPISRITAVTRG